MSIADDLKAVQANPGKYRGPDAEIEVLRLIDDFERECRNVLNSPQMTAAEVEAEAKKRTPRLLRWLLY